MQCHLVEKHTTTALADDVQVPSTARPRRLMELLVIKEIGPSLAAEGAMEFRSWPSYTMLHDGNHPFMRFIPFGSKRCLFCLLTACTSTASSLSSLVQMHRC